MFESFHCIIGKVAEGYGNEDKCHGGPYTCHSSDVIIAGFSSFVSFGDSFGSFDCPFMSLHKDFDYIVMSLHKDFDYSVWFFFH